MAARTFGIEDTPDFLLEENVTTLTLIRADPLAAPLVPRFEPLIADWNEVRALRIEIIISVATAVAKAFYLDQQLNFIVDELVAILEKITHRDRTDPLWTIFFNGENPYVFKQPTLAAQLAAMTVWPTSLAGTPHEELSALGAKLAPILPVAADAEKAVLAEKQRLVDFDNVGRWRQHVDRSNAERKAAFGFLSELRHKHPELRLSSGYADSFFRHDTSRRGAGKPKSSKEIGSETQALEAQLATLKADQQAALAREKKESDEAAEREQKRAELTKTRQEQGAAKAKAAALAKELKKSSKKKS